MACTSEKQGDTMVVRPTGRLDLSTAPEFAKECAGLIDAGERHIVVDFEGLDFVSSAGLRVILGLAKRLKAEGGKASFCGLRGVVKEVFELSGFVGLLSIFETLDEALAEQ